MGKKEVIVVLLVLAIAFSVVSVVMNFVADDFEVVNENVAGESSENIAGNLGMVIENPVSANGEEK